MATIRPFRPIRPNPFYAGELVVVKPGTESVAGCKDGLTSLKTLLEMSTRIRPETEEGQLKAFANVRQTLRNLIDSDRLWQDETPGIYVYEIIHSGRTQTGVWALTALEDYVDGTIRIHEHTLDDSVRRLKNYREYTSLEGSPILLTYPADPVIDAIISETKRRSPTMILGNTLGLHRVWKIRDRTDQSCLTSAFQGIKSTYLADGHHRLESARNLYEIQRQRGTVVYDTISSLYISTDEVHIEPYDRMVLNDGSHNTVTLIRKINFRFEVSESEANQPVRPSSPYVIGMLFNGQWYELSARPEICATNGYLAPEILQKHLLEPIFGISDPKNDPRLICAGGRQALFQIEALCVEYPDSVAFTLLPLTVDQLVDAAEEGRILPPKATWITPKVPYGLLMHYHI